MTKTQLVEQIQKILGGTKKEANAALAAVLDAIVVGLKKKDKKVALPGFGTFQVKHRKARWGRNPQTGERMRFKAKKVIKFRAGKDLKQKVL